MAIRSRRSFAPTNTTSHREHPARRDAPEPRRRHHPEWFLPHDRRHLPARRLGRLRRTCRRLDRTTVRRREARRLPGSWQVRPDDRLPGGAGPSCDRRVPAEYALLAFPDDGSGALRECGRGPFGPLLLLDPTPYDLNRCCHSPSPSPRWCSTCPACSPTTCSRPGTLLPATHWQVAGPSVAEPCSCLRHFYRRRLCPAGRKAYQATATTSPRSQVLSGWLQKSLRGWCKRSDILGASLRSATAVRTACCRRRMPNLHPSLPGCGCSHYEGERARQ